MSDRLVTQINIETPQPQIIFQDTAIGSTFDIVKGSGGTLLWLVLDNSLNTTPVFLQLFDNASPTVGSTSADEVMLCPAGSVMAVPKKGIGSGGYTITLSGFDLIPLPGTSITTASYFTGANPGKIFSNAITAAVTTSLAGKTGPVSAVVVTICYQ
jgi:hypothetical protein